MPADRLLGTLLRSLQTYTDQQDTPRILGTASSLLTTLTNPLNLTLLTSHLLSAPALWDRPDGLQTCLRVMGCFHSSAATLVREDQKTSEEKAQSNSLYGDAPKIGGGMSREEWVRSVVKGADERSQRWKHIVVLGGLLVGFEHQEQEGLSGSLRRTLEGALVQATNLALAEARHGDELAAHTVCLVLNHSFPLLSDGERARLDYDQLLPVLIGTAYFSSEGFESAYFLGVIAMDTKEQAEKLSWSPASQSVRRINRVLSRPLVSSMGPLSRLIAHAAENVRDPWLIQTMMDDLTGFTKALLTQWRQLKLAEVDAAEENARFTGDTLADSLPALWKLLRAALFATVIILRSVTSRLLSERHLSSDAIAPNLVTQTLHCLRNLYFISTRTGTASFTQYTFTYLTSIDILSAYPQQAEAFLRAIAPTSLGLIPPHALDRNLDLYFLNTAEHFTLILSPQVNEDLLIAAAVPYLASASTNSTLLQNFEAAHSIMLSVLSAPQSADLASKHLPFYIDALFRVFPSSLSPRQFRLAFKTLMRVSAPPSAISGSMPHLSGTLMEIVHHLALTASDVSLKPAQLAAPDAEADDTALMSEKAVLTLTFLDALPYLPLDLLEESLPMAAELLHRIPDTGMRRQVQERFWDVLVNGEMDPERSQVCVVWWGTLGGKEMVLGQRGKSEQEEGPYMSGALEPVGSKL